MIVAERTVEISPVKGGKGKKIEIPESLSILDDPKDVPPAGCGIFRIMTPKDGDKRIVWDNRSFAQIKDAKDTFNKLVAEGLVPYRTGVDGKATSEVMDEFDPYAEEVIFLPVALVAGG